MNIFSRDGRGRSDSMTTGELLEAVEPLMQAIRGGYYSKGTFSAAEVYEGDLSPPDLSMYAALNELVARGELEYLGPDDALTHTEMIYRVVSDGS